VSKLRKNTKKPRRKPLNPTQIALLITALGGFLSGLAALIEALT